MAEFDFFLSHSSENKELARFIYHNAIFNGLSVWYDESLLSGGDHLRDKLRSGIEQSNGYLLLFSHTANTSRCVQFEMKIAKGLKETNDNFRILVVKLDTTPIPEFWNAFLWRTWDSDNVPKSIIQLIQDISCRPTIMDMASAASLNNIPIFTNESCTMAEQSRNYILYYLCHVRQLIQNLGSHGHENELRDSLQKLLTLNLFEKMPNLQGGLLQIEPGVYEVIYPVRMRCTPTIFLTGLPEEYGWSIVNDHWNEIFLRFRVFSRATNQPVTHPIPIKILLSSEL
jgi:hypothetical protein